ncbi:unnamed protein product [Phaedon cochleariae]|uniref:Uncharacterized protein n=1 Tax=Phaedon cochleariae TaxID=80249 RepID=A0A9N9X3P4_PHACE|nr:unnamed protein product [Phaedon cochleariae]
MGFTERQKSEFKSLTKEITKEILFEFMNDKVFMDSIAKKVAEEYNKQIENLTARIDVMETKISDIQGEKEEFSRRVEDLEQKMRLDQLRFYGLPESHDENLKSTLEKIFSSKLKINPTIIQCYRIGERNPGSKQRPVIIKFASTQQRNAVYSAKKNFKGSNMIVAEDLIKSRHDLLIYAKDKLGRDKVWTTDGNLYTMFNGKRFALKSEESITKLFE